MTITSEQNFDNVYKTGIEFSEMILKSKYCINDNENTLSSIVDRISNELFEKFPNRIDNVRRISHMMYENRYLPAGSIMFGLGNNSGKSSLSNCYGIPINNDSIEAIYDAQKEIARTCSYRGGVGTDITVLRPSGDPVSNSAKFSSGAVSFLPMFSECIRTIGQHARRGALICTMDIRHPDVLKFIWCKARSEEIFHKDEFTGYIPNVNYANLSVCLTDDFMDCVEEDGMWTFMFPDKTHPAYDKEWDGDYDKWIDKGYPLKKYRTMRAVDVLKQIAEAAWLCGDPGISYYSHTVNMSPTYYDERLKPVLKNPCGEQPLPKYGNCLLGCLLMHKYVVNPWTKDAYFDIDLFLEDAENGIIFLDMMVDINRQLHPLQEQRDQDDYSRRVGQEFTGLADTLAMLGMDYGSTSSIDFIEDILHKKAIAEIETSIKLAKEYGCAECFNDIENRRKLLESPYIQSLFSECVKTKRESLEKMLLEYGVRNASWNTVGPTGSISIIADNCTSGMEPLFALEYFRETRFTPGIKNRIIHFPLLKYIGKSIFDLNKEEIKRKYHYKESHEISYIDRINVQSSIQKYIDASVSSTINLPESATIQDIYTIYLESWRKGLKGVTVFRDGSKKGILSTTENNDSVQMDSEEEIIKIINTFIQSNKEKLLSMQRAYRIVLNWKRSKVYVNVSYNEKGKPVEVFASVPKEAGFNDQGEYDRALYDERKSYWDCICRLISLTLRAGIDVTTVINQLNDASNTIADLPSGLARILKRFLNMSVEEQEVIKETKSGGMRCSSCGQETVIYQSGCSNCLSCGASSCG